MDIWHAAGTVEMGPDHRSVITGVNFGRGLPGPCTARAFRQLTH